MKFQEFMREVKKGEIRQLYYLHGDEQFLMDRCLRAVVERLVPSDLHDFNLNVFYGTETKGEEIAETAATLPMFADRRVVVVKKAEALSSSSLELLSSYVRDPSPATCLIFQGEKIDQRKKFFTEFSKKGALVEFKRLYENQLPDFIRDEVATRGKRIDPAAADMMVYLVGNSLQELVSEIEKAILYAGTRNTVTVDDIREVVSDTRVNSVFELADALGDKRLDRALRSLDTLIRGGEAPLMILAMITRHYRQLWKVRELLDKRMPTQQIAKTAGINPFFLQGVVRQAKNYTAAELRNIFRGIVKVDLALKTGRGKQVLQLEMLLMDVCSSGMQG